MHTQRLPEHKPALEQLSRARMAAAAVGSTLAPSGHHFATEAQSGHS